MITIRMFLIISLSFITFSSDALKNFVLIAAPGTGKGTFSQYLVQKFGYVQVCPGDIFRAEIEAQTELGKKIQPIVEQGAYVDEEITCQLIADNISRICADNKPFIIDGFPRSTISFDFLRNYFRNNNLVNTVCFLQFTANDNTCINRIITRLVCNQCHKVYNTHLVKPIIGNTCDDCKITLTFRKADTKDIAQQRIAYFHQHVESLMSKAAELYETKIITTERSIQELHKNYDDLI